ncbi:hypothetical protein PBY51_010996 [Eleginops maclovinus]|uniref:Uncharacterized protein n=1 Tax=Eleginops maclovinus TaxID=56733 RepID=A0AAN7X506_ELEMC|nr:hypothetical protein PBY51_010996 [Eleginops maclovinus]
MCSSSYRFKESFRSLDDSSGRMAVTDACWLWSSLGFSLEAERREETPDEFSHGPYTCFLCVATDRGG